MKVILHGFLKIPLMVCLLVLPFFAQARQQVVTGTITSSGDNSSLPGVNVLIKGTSTGTTTDANGKYSINASSGDVLTFSFIGYTTQEVPVGNQTAVNVSLETDITQLSEVVVVGYGSVEKKDLIGAVGIASSKDFGDVNVSSTPQLIQGKVAGVQVVNASGLPGSNVNIVVRGTGSFSNVTPLYVIDGIQGDANVFNSISANDIANITILKDAASIAIYGAAAANGVVLVTTKRAKTGAPAITYNAYYGVAQPWKKLDMMNAAQYVDLVKDITNNALTDKLKSPDALVDRTDWQNAIFRTAKVMEHNLGISGGTDKVTYGVSGTYTDQDGIMENYNFKRFNLRTSLEEKVGKRFRFGQNVNMRYTTKTGNTASFTDALRMPTYAPIYDPTNLGGFSKVTSNTDLNDAANPLTGVYLSDKKDRDFLMYGQFFGEVDIIGGLRFRTQASLSMDNYNGYNYKKANANGNLINPNGIDEYYGFSITPLIENYFSYTHTFGDHTIDATLGNTFQKNAIGRSVNLTGSNFPNDDIKNVVVAPSSRINGGSAYQGARLSYFGRVNYTFKDRYLLTATLRRDGSPVFSSSNRFGNFPAAGLGWKVNEEDFMKGITAISQLKLRGSYGKSGNDKVPLVQSVVWKGVSNNVGYSFGDGKTYTQGATVNSAVDPNLRWESTTQLDVGFDLGLFDDRFNLSVDYYDRKNEGLLTYVPLPLSSGIGGPFDTQGSILKNTASASNKGIEVTTSYQTNIGELHINVGGNVSYNKNNVTSLGQGSPFARGSVNGGNLATYTSKGHPIGSFFGYVVDHVASTQAEVDALNNEAKQKTGDATAVYQSNFLPGDIVFKDINNDGLVDSKDTTYLGSPIPKWNYGANLNLGYKNFDLTVGLNGIGGVKIWNDLTYWLEGTSRPFNSLATLENRWRTEGDVSEFPKAGQNANSSANLRPSTRFVENGAYLRVRNVTLGYRIPNDVFKNKITNLRIYITAQNLFTFTKYKGYDPEIGAQNADDSQSFLFARGIDGGNYPQPRTFMLGVQLGF